MVLLANSRMLRGKSKEIATTGSTRAIAAEVTTVALITMPRRKALVKAVESHVLLAAVDHLLAKVAAKAPIRRVETPRKKEKSGHERC